MSKKVSKNSSASKNLINQITLNCLMNTSQMMKLKNIKEKENIASNRIEKMGKYNNELLELFKTLLDGKGSISLNESFNDFIDKAIHHLDMLHDLKEQEEEEQEEQEEEEEEQQEEEEEQSKNLNNDIIGVLNVDYDEIMNEYERRKCLEKKEEEKEKEKEQLKKEEDDEYDEDDEY